MTQFLAIRMHAFHFYLKLLFPSLNNSWLSVGLFSIHYFCQLWLLKDFQALQYPAEIASLFPKNLLLMPVWLILWINCVVLNSTHIKHKPCNCTSHNIYIRYSINSAILNSYISQRKNFYFARSENEWYCFNILKWY